METVLVTLYFSVLLVLCAYGGHRAHLVFLCLRHRRKLDVVCPISTATEPLPTVTVQLPLYNEATVVERLLDAVARLDYPHHLLEIQVLDDSTDETRRLAAAKVASLRLEGLDIQHIRRPDRTGYKAGALDYGQEFAKGELIAVFDADFVPQSEFLRQVVPHFEDAGIGMVQTRWGHINRAQGAFTQVQALMLDGHHMVENRGRFGAGLMFNFSGTGGIWRKQAIVDAGGWEHDTLTEDLDLSYRAQMAGWRFVYRADVVTPSELPEDMSAFRAQQYRWAKGTVQTARKLMARIWSEPLGFAQKLEATFHLLPHFAYPLMVMLSVLLLPALILLPATDVGMMLVVDLPLCLGATGSLATFYIMAERAQNRSAWRAIYRLPALIALGAGMAPHLTTAVIEGMRHMAGEFVRTPKRGGQKGRYRQAAQIPYFEIALAAVSVASVVASIQTHHWFATPFAGLFASGYSYVAWRVLYEQFASQAQGAASSLGEADDVSSAEVARAA